MNKLISGIVLFFLFSGLSIFGQGNPLNKTSEDLTVVHNQNDFFFRVNIGYGYSHGKLEYENGPITEVTNGLTGLYNFQIGYTLVNNFILFADIGTTATKNSSILVNGNASSLVLEKFNIPAMGIGAIYYFMPLNIYILAELRVPQLIYTIKLTSGYDEYDSKFGIGAGISAGIELLLGKTWATGLAVTFLYDAPAPEFYSVLKSIGSYYVGVSATVTYN